MLQAYISRLNKPSNGFRFLQEQLLKLFVNLRSEIDRVVKYLQDFECHII